MNVALPCRYDGIMDSHEKIRQVDLASLKIIHYPDPRLREVCTPIDSAEATLAPLTEKMFALMFAAEGVGLAAPQVGLTVRLFVASPTHEDADRRVYINPEILSTEGSRELEEGCLSLPGVSCKVKRSDRVVLRATDLQGRTFEETGQELLARIFQHEIDHLDGRLLTDRMGSVAKLTNRRALKDLTKQFAES